MAAADIAARLYSRWTREEREDLVQDVLVKYLRTWSDGEGSDSLDAWLTTVTRNTAVTLDAARARREDPLHLRSAAEQRPDLIAELRNPHPRVY